MANEKRLIDANALIATLEKSADEDEVPFFHIDEITQEIFDAPTVDAVEVVRCKECRHCFHDSKLLAGLVEGEYVCGIWGRGLPHMKPGDFCSYGERREGE